MRRLNPIIRRLGAHDIQLRARVRRIGARVAFLTAFDRALANISTVYDGSSIHEFDVFQDTISALAHNMSKEFGLRPLFDGFRVYIEKQTTPDGLIVRQARLDWPWLERLRLSCGV